MCELKQYNFRIGVSELEKLREIRDDSNIKNVKISVAFLLNVATSNLIKDIEENGLNEVIGAYIAGQ